MRSRGSGSAASKNSFTMSEGDSKSGNSTLRARGSNPAANKNGSSTSLVTKTVYAPESEVSELRKKVEALHAEAGKPMGRDAAVILKDGESLKDHISTMSLRDDDRKEFIEKLDEVDSQLAWEVNVDKHCSKYIQLILVAITIIPMLLTAWEGIYEFATRPIIEVGRAELYNKVAIVTGGYGSIGLELAVMLANSSAGVVLTYHGAELNRTDRVREELDRMGLLRNKARSNRIGWVDVWPLQLESLASVREFAARVGKELGTVDILVHNAATKKGCIRTEDGHEMVTQVNYLAPFLLNQLLLPALQNSQNPRVVHVTCYAGLQQPDWLPWPLRRTQAELLPRLSLHDLLKRHEESQRNQASETIGECSALAEYANTKLAVLLHSQELNRRMASFDNPGVSHVVNPGALNAGLGLGDSTPSGKPSMRSSMVSSLPPVWIATKLYQVTLGKLVNGLWNLMLRDKTAGAKALFHVATAEALGEEDAGAGLYSDVAGAFTDCGKAPHECGRVPLQAQPDAVNNDTLISELWDVSERVLGLAEDVPEEDIE